MSGSTLQASGKIKMTDIVSVFGGTSPHKLREYYRGGGRVPNVAINNTIPTSGKIKFSNFYNTGLQTVAVIQSTKIEVNIPDSNINNSYIYGSNNGYTTFNTILDTLGSQTKLIIAYCQVGTGGQSDEPNDRGDCIVRDSNNNVKTVDKVLTSTFGMVFGGSGGETRDQASTCQYVCSLGNSSSFKIKLHLKNRVNGTSPGPAIAMIAQVDAASFTSPSHTNNTQTEISRFTIPTVNPSCTMAACCRIPGPSESGGPLTDVLANDVSLSSDNKLIQQDGKAAIGLDPLRTGENVTYTFGATGTPRGICTGCNFAL